MSSNTKKEGQLHFFTYFDSKEGEYVGVCVELGIVLYHENPHKLEDQLREAAVGYVETVIKENMPDTLLNQEPAKEYLEMYEMLLSSFTTSRAMSKSMQRIERPTLFTERVPA